MNCPACSVEMKEMALEGHQGTAVVIDVCSPCRVFWFDKYESLKLAAASTLRLLGIIGEQTLGGPAPSGVMRCPRCEDVLRPTQDMQRNTRFSYWRCDAGHGRLIRFFEFLREKDFIRTLSPKQIEQLRQQIQTVNCSNCGAPVDVAAAAACTHCGSPLSMIDLKQPQRLIEELRKQAEPKAIELDLALKLARAKSEIDRLFSDDSTW